MSLEGDVAVLQVRDAGNISQNSLLIQNKANDSLFLPCSWKDLHQVSELPDIEFSLAHNRAEDLNILLKSIYCISGPLGAHLRSLPSFLFPPHDPASSSAELLLPLPVEFPVGSSQCLMLKQCYQLQYAIFPFSALCSLWLGKISIASRWITDAPVL